MTIDRYRSHWIPQPIVVRCRRCEAGAHFFVAFQFCKGAEAERALADANLAVVRFSSGAVIVRFPDLFPWNDPANYWIGFNRPVAGVVTCPRCGSRYKLVPEWPADAFYRIACAPGVLWAWDRAHLVAARDFIASMDRDPAVAGTRYAYFLRHLPAEFLAMKVRESVTKAIDRFLSENG